MFYVEEQKLVTTEVIIHVPVDGGRSAKHSMQVTYEIVPKEVSDTIYDDGGDDRDLLKLVVKGFDHVATKDKQPIVYSDESLHKLVNISYVRVAWIKKYLELSHGEGKRKNS